MDVPQTPKVRRNMRAQQIITVLFALLLFFVGGTLYFYWKANHMPGQAAKNELDRTVELVGKIMVLPDNETPSLATVSDPEKLKGQAFFAKARSGDKVLIYSLAKKAILYSPTQNKIVEVAPVNLGVGNK